MSKVGQMLQLAALIVLVPYLITALVKRARNRASGVATPASTDTHTLLILAMIVSSLPGAVEMDGRAGFVAGPVSIGLLLLAISRWHRADAPRPEPPPSDSR